MVDTSKQIDLGGNDLIINTIYEGATAPGQAGTQLTATNLGVLAGVTAGTAAASKAVVLDSGTKISGIKNVTLAAGTATVAPINLTSGTNLTAAVAGAVEYDGSVFYASPTTSTRAVLDAEHFITNTATFTLTSQTAAQALFNQTGATAGSLTLPASQTYWFEGFFSLSSLSASSGSFGFALGGTANLTAINWMSLANKATLATQVAWQGTWNASAANTALTAANTNTVGAAYVKGTFTMTTTGTVIPQVSQGNAAAAVVGVGSWFRFVPVGSNTVAQVGNWS